MKFQLVRVDADAVKLANERVDAELKRLNEQLTILADRR